MLWLALHLPRLPLEAFPSQPPPSAVVSREHVVVADETAASAGVRPGMRLASAWALLPELHILERDCVREQVALKRLACRAGAFTSEVCLLAPHTLLLEVAGSLRLFGGTALLLERVVEACCEQGFTLQTAFAPTPLAAQWLAQAGAGHVCLAAADLPQHLAALPLAALALSAQQQARLAGFGVRLLGDVLCLPRAGLARRLGVGFTDDLSRALGDLPDPRPRFAFPEHFFERLELPGRVENTLALGFSGRRLIAALCGWLTARSAGISECIFEFEHERGSRPSPATCLTLGLSGVTRDAERIGRILVERLQQLELPAAVVQIALRAEAPALLSGYAASLFGECGEGRGGDSIAVLVERLQARLGETRVHGLATFAEHRPENASRLVAPLLPVGKTVSVSTAMPATTGGPRPLWLLPRPQSLHEVDGRPQRGGPLQLLAGPERIESGWWDAAEADALGDVRRDYFVVLSPRSEWLWIFRSEAGWFLHGVFA
ncbi:MAG: DNA polymerase Y family protein [Rhodocyclaceae bacterium]